MSRTEVDAFARFVDIVRHLRSPEGCPWDREQTLPSLAPHLLEETYETVDAVHSGDSSDVSEELGDMFLLATMLSIIHEESNNSDTGSSTLQGLLDSASDKLVRRHPHVFGDAPAKNSGEVKRQWDDIKESIEGRPRDRSALSGVSKGLPPLERAYKLQKRARKVGFDWPDLRSVLGKVREELSEVEDADQNDREAVAEELGDLLFSVVNVARYLDIDPSIALHSANEKFAQRFRSMEDVMQSEERPMQAESVDRMNEIWEGLKKRRQSGKP